MSQLTMVSVFALVKADVAAREDECRVPRRVVFRCSTMMLGMLFWGAVSVDLDRWDDVSIDPDQCRRSQPTCGRR